MIQIVIPATVQNECYLHHPHEVKLKRIREWMRRKPFRLRLRPWFPQSSHQGHKYYSMHSSVAILAELQLVMVTIDKKDSLSRKRH